MIATLDAYRITGNNGTSSSTSTNDFYGSDTTATDYDFIKWSLENSTPTSNDSYWEYNPIFEVVLLMYKGWITIKEYHHYLLLENLKDNMLVVYLCFIVCFYRRTVKSTFYKKRTHVGMRIK